MEKIGILISSFFNFPFYNCNILTGNKLNRLFNDLRIMLVIFQFIIFCTPITVLCIFMNLNVSINFSNDNNSRYYFGRI